MRTFLSDVGTVASLRAAGGGLLFLSQVMLAAWMGAAEFGAYSLAWAWVAVLATLAGLGLPGTSVRFIAKYEVEQNEGALRGLLQFCRSATMAAALALMAVAIAIVYANSSDPSYRNALLISFTGIPTLALLNLDAATARGFGWMGLSVVAEQIARPILLMLIAGALVATMQSPRVEHFVVACSAAYALAALGQRLVVRQRVQAKVPPREIIQDRSVWLATSAGILLLNGAQVVRMNMDPMWIGLLLAPADVGIYTAALRVATLVSFILMIGGVVAQPTISALHAKGARRQLEHFLARTTRGIFLASLAVGVVLALAGPLILSMLGGEFVAGYPALLVLVAAHVLAAFMGPLTAVLIMTGRQRSAAYIYLAVLPIQAALSILLIRWQGVFGAALAAGTGTILSQLALRVAVQRTMSELAQEGSE